MDDLLSSLDNTLIGFWDWHINDDYEYLSPGFKQMLGYAEDEMEDHPSSWQRCIHDGDLKAMFAEFDKHVNSQGKIPFQQIATFRHRHGHDLLILCSGQVTEWNDDGSPARAMGTHVDLTALSGQQNLVRQQEMFHKLLFDTTSDAVMVFEVIDKDNMQYRLLRYNPAAKAFWGGGDEEMQTFNFLEQLVVDDVERAILQWRNTLEEQGYLEDEIQLITLTGQQKTAIIHVNRIDIGDKPIIHATYRDITEERNRLLQVEQALEQERTLNNLRKSFVSTASHQFRTPLAIIQSNADLVERCLPDDAPAPLTKAIHRVTKEVEHMTTLMDDVVLLGQIEAQKLVVHTQELAPAERITLICEQYFAAHSHRLHIDIPNDLTLSADPTYFEHILINIVSNACKYSDADTPIHIRGDAKGDEVVITVQDQGLGIPQAEIPHLTNSFYRGENVKHIAGSGLGLNIVEQLLTLMKGSIQIQSKEGVGTHVSLYFQAT